MLLVSKYQADVFMLLFQFHVPLFPEYIEIVGQPVAVTLYTSLH